MISLQVGDKVTFIIDTDTYSGVIKNLNDGKADVLVFMGLITNIPIKELNYESI